MKPIKTILCATDFSLPCEHALRVACALAGHPDACLVLLHVVPHSMTGSRGPAMFPGDEYLPQDPKAFREELRTKLRDLPLPGLKARVERVLAEGDAVAAILRTAQEHSCDVIVMGTHGWTGVARRLMGSVAEDVMRRAACPVVAVRVPIVEPAPAEASAPEEAGLIL